MFAIAAVALDRAFPPDLSRLDAVGTEVTDREGRTLALLPAPGGVWRFRTAVDDVSPDFLRLLIAVEDRHYYRHPGVDPLALLRAAGQWVRAGRIVSGGSTLTMQVVRLLHPQPRTLRAKAVEIARALQLEAHYSKRDILGMWLTLAPFGGNLEGVRAGSLAWFGVPPSLLDPAEAALLVAIPRRPEALRPDRHPDRAALIRARVLNIAEQAGVGAATAMPLPTQRVAFPRLAPQIVTALPRLPQVATTLDLPLQAALERFAARQLAKLPERASLAILVADLRTREIRAIYGGAWGQEGRAGSLDLTHAIRSPGSALKPFIYGLAIEDGLIAADTPVSDLPRRFGAYAPEDFDRGFAGQITAAEALRRSLNLPAVALLDRIGPTRYAAALRAAGVSLHLPPGADPSLPLALGGVGITLRDVAALYAGLGTDGSVATLKIGAADSLVRRPLLDPNAARVVADILTRRIPGALSPGIAWKTGTSWGGRDAWAAGFNATTVVALWVGRPDGTALPGATGQRLALPLLGQVFDLLPPAPRLPARPAPMPRPESAEAPDQFRMLFPPPGAVLAPGDVVIRLMGGRRPFTFLVDGAPLPAEPFRREAHWSAESAGFYRVTVIDAEGDVAQSQVRVKE